MKKELFTIAAAAFICSRFRIKSAYAWNGDVHVHIASKALELLEKEKKLRPAAFYRDWHSKILEGAVQPDKMSDIDKGSGMHYYSCKNAKGKDLDISNGFYRNRLGSFMPSARTLFRANYTAAVSLYKSGRTSDAMLCLGRAVHFVSDMGCTPHVANMKIGVKTNNVHHAFEKHVGSNYSYTADGFDKRLTKYYEKADPGEGFDRLIKYSAKFVDSIVKLDTKIFDDIAKHTIPVTEQHVMAVLLKFYDDCNANNGNFLCDEKQYCFKNEGTGLALTVTPKALTLAEPNKEKEQKLTVKLGELGTFGLRAADGGYVDKKLKGFDHPKKDGKAAQFRAEALGSRRFVITTEDSGYEKVLAVKGGKLVSAVYEPEKSSMIWIVN